MEELKTNGDKTRDNVLYYLKALTNTAREPFLILDADLKVLAANPFFYKTFQVSPEQTENKFVYMLGEHEWNIPKLKVLLEKILPEKKTITDFDVTHVFPKIGERTVRLNARQIDALQLIILAFEDITARKRLENEAVAYTVKLEEEVAKRTEDLEAHVEELKELTRTFVGREMKIVELKKIVAGLEKRVKGMNHINHKPKTLR